MTSILNKQIAQRPLSRQGRIVSVQPRSGMDRLGAAFTPNHGYEWARCACAIGERLSM